MAAAVVATTLRRTGSFGRSAFPRLHDAGRHQSILQDTGICPVDGQCGGLVARAIAQRPEKKPISIEFAGQPDQVPTIVSKLRDIMEVKEARLDTFSHDIIPGQPVHKAFDIVLNLGVIQHRRLAPEGHKPGPPQVVLLSEGHGVRLTKFR